MKKLLIIGTFLALIMVIALSGCGPASTPPVQREFTADASTVALWHFNEGSGTTVADSSSTGNFPLSLHSDAGTPVLATFVTSGRNGFGNCLSMVGANKQYASTTTAMSSSFANDISVEFWVNVSSLTSEMPIFMGPSFSFRVYLSGAGKIHIYLGNGITWSAPDDIYSQSLSTGSWHYIACTYSSSANQVKIYIDGSTSFSETPNITGAFNSGGTCDIGMASNAYYFTGQLDEMRVSNSARTASEISAYYTQATQP